jgi:N-dimethylarginine dimethylaminohydrolase
MYEPAATFGGPGFRERQNSHDEDIGAADLWRRCGAQSEYGPLRTVLLAEPRGRERFEGRADEQLLLELPDPGRLRAQFEALRAGFSAAGVEVLTLQDDLERRPNLLFQRDLFAMLRHGAVLARPASLQRAGEECIVARCLAAARVPIVGMMTGTACMEGADLLWYRPDELLVGVGRRTNREAVARLRRLVASERVRVTAIPLCGGTQHLLGVVNRIDDDLVVLDRERASARLRRALRQGGIDAIELPPDEELRARRGANVIALGDRRVLMPSGCPGIRRRLDAHRVDVVEVDVSEYIRAGGGIACATGIIHRESAGSSDCSPTSSRRR